MEAVTVLFWVSLSIFNCYLWYQAGRMKGYREGGEFAVKKFDTMLDDLVLKHNKNVENLKNIGQKMGIGDLVKVVQTPKEKQN